MRGNDNPYGCSSGVKTGTGLWPRHILSCKGFGLDFIDVTYEDYDFLIAEKLQIAL